MKHSYFCKSMTLSAAADRASSVAAGAGSSDGNGKGEDLSIAVSNPFQACLDDVDAIAKVGVRCTTTDYQRAYDVALEKTQGSTIAKVSDEPSFRGACLPSIETASCSAAMEARYDAGCAGKFERTAGYTRSSSDDSFATPR